MRLKTVATGLLLAFVVASVGFLFLKESQSDSGAVADPVQSRLVAYYFHGNMRCATCRKIEAYAREAIEEGFPEAVADGSLEFRAVNVDQRVNEHFIRDYRLASRSVVLASFRNGEQQEWRDLDQVWQLVGDRDAFLAYVRNQTGDMLGSRTP